MYTQNIDLTVGLIAAIAALIGAAIPTIIGYFTSKKLESQRLIKEKQKEVYFIFLQSYQNLKNASDPDTCFVKFQSSLNQICLYGDNKTSNAVKSLFDDMLKSIENKHPLNDDQLQKHETNIMNAMRKELGLKGFDSFFIRGFIPEKQVK